MVHNYNIVLLDTDYELSFIRLNYLFLSAPMFIPAASDGVRPLKVINYLANENTRMRQLRNHPDLLTILPNGLIFAERE